MYKGQRGRAKTYDTDSLMIRSVLGILLIAVGLISLISIVGGFDGALFDTVETIMQGIGGWLCLGIPLFFIWGGALIAFSARRRAPVRAILLLSLLFMCVLGVINLMSGVNPTPLMEYIAQNNSQLINPDGYWETITGAYRLCSKSGAFGGALGMVTAWPLWTYVGAVGGAVILGFVSLICVIFVSRFDIVGTLRQYRDSSEQRLEERTLRRDRRTYEKQLQKEKAGMEAPQAQDGSAAQPRRTRAPAPATAQQQAYAGFQNVPMWPQGAPVGTAAAQQTLFAPAVPVNRPSAPELYDEMIVPEIPNQTESGKAPGWKPKARKPKKADREPVTVNEQNTAFVPLDREETRVLQQMEENRRRKMEIDRRLGEMNGKDAQDNAPAMENPVLDGAGRRPKITKKQMEYANQTAAYQTPERTVPEAPSAPPDPYAAYRKPAGSANRAERVKAQGTQVTIDQVRAGQSKLTAKKDSEYPYPMIELLDLQTREIPDTSEQDHQDARKLEKTLESFDIPARVQRVTHGPAVTRFELGLVSSGINVRRIMGIADNIALDMAANGGVRIEVPIPGTNLFGVEIPNKEIIGVSLAEVLTSPEMSRARSPLSVALGKDIAGKPVICDLAKMPHLLIAGQTGSGKSVCINSIINSLLYRATPDEVRMIMIDPKVVELQGYNQVPHLLIPVVSDPHKASGALAWAVQEMLDRYHKMQSKGVREITTYNAKVTGDEPKLPRIVIIIDELSDLMLACKKEVEESIIRLAQLARAAGIHVVVATQRPTVNVITGLIKANIPSRIAFAVASSIDSRTILDMNGAEKLLGRGDMFYYPTGAKAPLRVQGSFISDAEISNVVDYIGRNSETDYDESINEVIESPDTDDADSVGGETDGDLDERLQEAIEMVLTDGQASISMLQRRMKVGYARAGRLIDDMASRGIVSKSAGTKPREVLMTYEQYLQQKDQLLR